MSDKQTRQMIADTFNDPAYDWTVAKAAATGFTGITGIGASRDGKYILCTSNTQKAFLSTDGGQTFNELAVSIEKDKYPGDVLVSETGQYMLFYNGGTGAFRSVDYGATWNTIQITDAGHGDLLTSGYMTNDGKCIVFSGLDLNYESYRGLWVSTDYGATFRDILTSEGVKQVWVSSVDYKMYYRTNSGVYTSVNFGQNWTKITSLVGLDDFRGFGVTPNGQHMALIHGSWIYFSSDYGKNFKQVYTHSSLQSFDYEISISDDGEKIIVANYFGGRNYFYSVDFGVTWVHETAKGETKWPYVSPDGRLMVIAADMEFIASYNGGVDWAVTVNTSSTIWDLEVSKNNLTIVIGEQNDTILVGKAKNAPVETYGRVLWNGKVCDTQFDWNGKTVAKFIWNGKECILRPKSK